MKFISLAALLVVGILLAGPSVAAAPQETVPTTWDWFRHYRLYDVMFTQEPARETKRGVWTLWYKLVYTGPQPSPQGQYDSEIVQFEIDCGGQTVALLRDLKYSASRLLSDERVPQSHLVHISFYSKDSLDTVSNAIRRLGMDDSEEQCRTND